ncbi:probable chitinase 2 isoform X1 [Leguminivora glycinivorella]|uniref:probable chitinase 2 isoform X1 n=1 Tax=Leguminivora glycinivorella TaxID=1035111 RepID=UPI0020103B12|nr:probable chitinase 2 isoform X1 [Leguminivora glycinivorella]
MSLFLKFVFGVVLLTVFVEGHDKVVVCYYGTWATYRSGDGKFSVSDINASLCTHLVYTFVGIHDDGTVISLDPYLDLPDNQGLDNFKKFNALKQQNNQLKTILAVGGWNQGSANYSTMAASATLRKTFITTARDMVLTYGFDGLDIDWEYPNQRDSTQGVADVNNFSLLLKELREEFDKHGLLITVAVAAVESSASLSYDIPNVAKYVDLVNIMTYDLYGAWDSITGHNAPLHVDQGRIYAVDAALNYWLSQGCPPEKVVMGIPFYGRTFNLTDANNNGVGAPSSGVGFAGQYTATKGFVGYNEFCTKLNTETWDVLYDSIAQVPYAIQDKNWVSYDDPNSIAKKVEYAMNLGIAGAMVWSIETDDFHGKCGEDFALLRAINSALAGSSTTTTTSTTTPSTTTTTKRPTTTSTAAPTHPTTVTTTTSTTTTSTVKPTTTTTSAPSALCTKEGPIPNPDDCSTFFICVQGNYGMVPTLMNCPANLVWDDENKICNYRYLVKCEA